MSGTDIRTQQIDAGCVKLMETFEGGQYSYAVMEMLGLGSGSGWVFDISTWEIKTSHLLPSFPEEILDLYIYI